MNSNIQDLAEAFGIFAKYTDWKYTIIHAHGGTITVQLDIDNIPKADIDRLTKLGWKYSGLSGFYCIV